MKITLRLKGPLSRYADGASLVEVELDETNNSARKLLALFGIPASSVSFIQINRLKTDLDQPIKGGDVVTFNPRVAGG